MSSIDRNSPTVYPKPWDDWSLLEELPFEDDRAWFAELLEECTGDAPEPGSMILPFSEWIMTQAAYFRSEGTRAGSWLAGEIEVLGELARTMGAGNPDEFESRREVLERGRAEDLVEAGYTRGRADGQGFDFHD